MKPAGGKIKKAPTVLHTTNNSINAYAANSRVLYLGGNENLCFSSPSGTITTYSFVVY
jgi:hypothetical protein